MVKIPSLSRRREAEPESARDIDNDGLVDDRDPVDDTDPTPVSPPVGGAPAVAERTEERTTYRSVTTDDERSDDDRAEEVEPRPEVVVDRGPRPRASLLATTSLIIGVAGALFVLTGALAGYGMVLGGIGALLGVAGLSATRRRHVAGTTEAMLGLIFGLGAVVLGILAMTGQFLWPSTDGDWVQRFREWLDAQFVDRF